MRTPAIIASAVFALLFTAGAALAQVHVEGYYRKDGTYVAPHYRSSPNKTTRDNWSTKGNVNPFTGKRGTRNPSPDTGFSGRRPSSPFAPSPRLAPNRNPWYR